MGSYYFELSISMFERLSWLDLAKNRLPSFSPLLGTPPILEENLLGLLGACHEYCPVATTTPLKIDVKVVITF